MNKQKAWFFVAFIFSICTVVLLLSYIVTDPGHMLIVLGGDGGHTYHSLLYHITYEKGAWSYCMNYPYGENMIYIDGLPFLSIPLSYAKALHLTPERELAIMHLSIGLSYTLAILYIYKTLTFFKVKPLLAVLFSCLIILTTPQAYRLLGHFALSNACVVPMLFYWSVRYYNNQHWRYPLYIFVFGCIMSFFHLYFGGIIFMWILFYALGTFIFSKQNFIAKLRHDGLLILAGVGMLGVVKSVIWLTDPVKDRPSYSSGAMEHLTNWKIILTSPLSPFWSNILKKYEWLRDTSSGEGYVYVGVAVALVCIISIVCGLLLRKNKSSLVVAENKFQPIWLFIGIGALILGMGIPFIWNMTWLFNYLPLFRQFRSMGRFSWIFYYVITVYAVVVINGWYVKAVAAKKHVIAYTTVILFLSIWCVDAKGYVSFFRPIINDGPGKYSFYFSKQEQNWPQFLAEHHYSNDSFQAIIVLPFYNVGSEKLSAGNYFSQWVSTTGGKASVQLHLPVVDALAARESLSNTEKQVRLSAGPFADKPLFNSGNRKPFLVLQSHDDSLDADTKYLLKDADYLGHSFGFFIYACYPDRINANDRKYADTVKSILPYMHASDTCVATNGIWFVKHFDAGLAKDKFFGNGANAPIAGEDSIIADFRVHPLADSQVYEFSVWFYLHKDDPNCPNMYVQLSDSSGNLMSTNEILTKCSVDNSGLWFRNSGFFYMPVNCRSIKCKLVNRPSPSYIAMDELLIRPANALIISKATDGRVMVNNHVFRN